MTWLELGRDVFNKEIKAAEVTRDSLGKSFENLCTEIDGCTGKVVFTGMGKSGHICKKVVATMQSLGIKAQFMHPAEALHGDLGMLTDKDLIIAVSNGGETEEVLKIVPAIRSIGSKLYCIVGRAKSTLGKLSDEEVLIPTSQEVFLGSLVPTASTTATLMLGDALAVAVASKRGFTPEDFAVYHPNGLLGKRLTLKVEQLMLSEDENAKILSGSTVQEAIFEMCRKPIGGVNIVNDEDELLGIFTDGDLRRFCFNNSSELEETVIDTLMTKTPIKLNKDSLVADVIEDMKKYDRKVSFYPVVEGKKLVGTLRLLDISKSGLL